MKIKETIERECCETKDLRPYKGMVERWRKIGVLYCIHCGELWITVNDNLVRLAEREGLN